jgi:hypothetical protein
MNIEGRSLVMSSQSLPELDRSSQMVRWVLFAACAVAMAVVAIWYALGAIVPATSATSEYDYDFTGDAQPLQTLDPPDALREVTDRPGCTAAGYARCFVTDLDRPGVLAYLHNTVGAAAPDFMGQPLKRGWSACGDSLGPPAIGFIRRDVGNYEHTGRGSWNIPEDPIYNGRLVVGIMLVNAPHCV